MRYERDLFVVKKMKNRTAGVDGAQRIPGCLVENLQLSNKSLRLRYYLDWLQQVTWCALGERELCTVVFPAVICSPIRARQTESTNSVFVFYSGLTLSLGQNAVTFIWLTLPTPFPFSFLCFLLLLSLLFAISRSPFLTLLLWGRAIGRVDCFVPCCGRVISNTEDVQPCLWKAEWNSYRVLDIYWYRSWHNAVSPSRAASPWTSQRASQQRARRTWVSLRICVPYWFTFLSNSTHWEVISWCNNLSILI